MSTVSNISSSTHSLKAEKPLTPPLNPYSPQEIASFQKLDLALRSHPELAREGATLLNPKALARLVQGIKFFQDTHLGRLPSSKYSENKRWPIMKLPDEFFRMRSADGPLFHLFVSAYRYKKDASWRQFDFQSKNRYNDNMALLKKIHKDLIAEGQLRRPVVYIDQTVPQERRAEYKATIKKFGGRIVKDIAGTGDNAPTHVLCWDEEEHDSVDTLEGEERAGDAIEKLFLKTLAIVDPKAKAKKSGGIIETTMQDSKKKGGKIKHGKGGPPIVFEHPMAFVHWWYHPSSYDEWMPAADVAGADTDVPPRPPGGPWIVGCKFVRDVARFNEWGTEADYAVSDYQKKVMAYPELEEKLAAEAKAREVVKPLKIRLSLSSAKVDKAKKEQAPADEKKEPEEVLKEPEKRKRKSNYAGMMPKQIFTGFYSDSNKRLKRTVHDGALRIPRGTIDLVREAIKNVSKIAMNGEDLKLSFPDMDDVLRPSLDPMLAYNFSVTELQAGDNGTTLVTARRLLPPVVQPERIRGGGDEDIVMEDASEKVGQQSVTPVIVQQAQSVADTKASAPVTTNVEKTQETTSVPAASAVTSTSRIQEQPPLSTLTPTPNIIVAAPVVETSGSPVPASKTSKTQIPLPVPTVAASIIQVPSVQTVNSDSAAAPVTDGVSAVKSNDPIIERLPVTPVAPVTSPVPAKPNVMPQAATPVLADGTSHPQPVASMPKVSSLSTVPAPPIVSTTVDAKPIHLKTLNTGASGQVISGAASPEAPKSSAPSIATSNTNTKPLPQAQLNTSVSVPSVIPQLKAPVITSAPTAPEARTSASNGSTTKQDTRPAPLAVAPLKPVGTIVSDVAVIKTLPSTHNGEEEKKLPLTGDQQPTTILPPWYDSKSASEVEKTVLPEWFNESAIHRTEKTYMIARERIIDVARRSSTKYLTSTAVRRCVAGDAGSIMRLHRFLVTWGFINGSAIGDSAPLQVTKENAPKSILSFEKKWTTQMIVALGLAVNDCSSKKRLVDDNVEAGAQIKWDEVAKRVGKSVTPNECYEKFLSTDFGDEKLESNNVKIVEMSASIENTSNEDLVADLIDGVKPEVAKVVVDAALDATDGVIKTAKRAGVLGVISSQAIERAQKEEAATGHILQQILDLRMAKLENRLSLLDDLEGMLDAERMALELERRDLYTNRCRHWFNADL